MKPTPFIDQWRSRVGRQLAARGRKADLARHLASLYGGEELVWQRHLQSVLKRQVPRGETLLAIDAWLDHQT